MKTVLIIATMGALVSCNPEVKKVSESIDDNIQNMEDHPYRPHLMDTTKDLIFKEGSQKSGNDIDSDLIEVMEHSEKPEGHE